MSLRAPNVFVLIFGIMLVVGAATWFVPPGQYQREADAHGHELVVQQSYEQLDVQSPPASLARAITGDAPSEGRRQGLWQVLQSPLTALMQRSVARTVGFILLIGGAFGVLQASGALVAGLHALSQLLGEQRLLVIPVLMAAFSLGGATFGMAEESIAFVLVTVPLAISLRFDTITGVAIPFVGSQIGFATAWLNPFTLGIAKDIAGLEVGDEVYRVFCWVLGTILMCGFVTWHAWRVWQDPSRSLTPEVDAMWRSRLEGGPGRDGPRDDNATESGPGGLEAMPALSVRHGAILIVFAAAIGVIAYGGANLDWYVVELSAVFLGMAILVGLIAGMSPGKLADTFVAGAKDLSGVALLIAFANAIRVLAEQGMIIDTALHFVETSLEGIGKTTALWLMFLVQSAINFFVPSGSGQAALTMPLMAPLSDVLGVSRNSAVLAYQFGDGFTNIVVPTNAVLMGCISAGKVEFGTWLRWVWKVELALFAFAFVMLAFAPY